MVTALKKVYIRTFGCQMNEYDSHKLYRILESTHRPADSPADADLIVINTCSVREKPEQKLYSLLGEMRELRKGKPGLLVGVGGCVAQQEGSEIVKRSREVDFVFGTHNLSLVPSLIARREQGAGPQVAVDYRDEWEELPLGFSEFDKSRNRVSAFISISRGCNKNCTYCIVPVTRGPEVSRSFDEILSEVKLSVRRGAREIVLLGQTVNSYGLDLKPRRRFIELLEAVSGVEGVERIRFTSPHPQEVRPDFFRLLAGNRKICRHIHMPLQSGSDRILKAMNRNYRKSRYFSIIDGLLEIAPDMAVTTDIIVGFPGESVEDFEQTLDVMKRVRFHNSYSFMYSPRPGTPAASMEDQIAPEEKLRRLKILQELQDEITAERLAEFVGHSVEVLLEGPSQSDGSCLQGRISQNVLLNLLKPEPDIAPGMLINAQVSAAARYTLKGQYCRFAGAQDGLYQAI